MIRFGIAWVALFSPAATMAAEPQASVVDDVVAEALKSWNVPGLALTVVRGDETLVLKGYGPRCIGKDEPITPDTIFPLASGSKAFTTALLAMLVDDDVMGWDDPVRKHLAGFRLSDPNANALLVIRDLLCHRCGLAGHDLLWYHAPWSIDEVLKRASLLPLDYPFRAGYRYSTIPFLAAGRAIELRTGEKWDKLVRRRICEPLGMTGVAFTTTEIARAADRSEGHRLNKSGKLEVMTRYEMPQPNPAGSVFATARDLAIWLKFHLSEGRAPDGSRLVSVKNLRETHTAQNIIRLEGSAKLMNPDTTQLSYAMAWLVYDHRGKKVISHGGLIDGFRIQLTFLPEENVGFAIMANLHDTRLTAALTNSLIDLYCDLPPKNWNRFYHKIVAEDKNAKEAANAARDKLRDPQVQPTCPLQAYAGKYSQPAYGVATVALQAQRLVLSWSSFRCELKPFKGDLFQIADGFFEDQLVSFGVVDGKVGTLKFTGQEFKRQ